MSELTSLEFFNGILGIILIVFFFYIGISIMRKFFQYGDKRLLYVSLAIFFMSFPWLPIAVSFISVIISAEALPFDVYFILGYGISLGMFFWLLAFTNIVNTNKRKSILVIYSFYLVVVMFFFYYFLFTNPSLIGSLSGAITASHGAYLRIRNLIRLVILVVTAYLIWYNSKRSSSPEIRFKGRMILIGIILYVLGGVLFTITNISLIPLMFFIPSLFGIYAGLALPEWMKRFFSFEEKTENQKI